jgi:FKBP-type peptidyl-prolyl cis-trans isomerase
VYKRQGWNPKGVVFDQSISDGKLIAPIAGGNLITGWNEGVIGMKIGGVRELSIPSDKAYGSTGSGDNIPPNTPIKFIVMIIPKVEDVPVPAELLKYYQSQSISS